MKPSDHAAFTLLWSSTDDDGTPLDRCFDISDFSQELSDKIEADWNSFRQQAEAMGFDAPTHRTGSFDPTQGDEWDCAAHDFILTRNHHGAGFWDGDWTRSWGEKLTVLANSFGEINCYYSELTKKIELY
jgi:hypothetical protein